MKEHALLIFKYFVVYTKEKETTQSVKRKGTKEGNMLFL